MSDQRKGTDASGTGTRFAGTSFDDPNYGANNKAVTREQAMEAYERLRELLVRPLGLWVGSRAKVLSTAELIEVLKVSEAKGMSATEFIELLNASERRRGDDSMTESD